MARYVLPVIGGVAGFIFGGPTGASLGWALGSAVGGLVDPQVIKGPSIGDLPQQTSQEGVPRPIVFNLSPPIAGNIIASAQPLVVRNSSGGGKGGPKVETEAVYRTYAIRVCEGPIDAIVRVWRNNQLVYDIRSGSSMSAENSKFLQTARLYTGEFDQDPSPDLEAVFGVGTTPAHRGTAYIVMANDDLTDLRGAIPQFQFQVEHTDESVYDVESIVSYICQAVGMDETMYDTLDIDQSVNNGYEVQGMMILNTYPAYAALQTLSQVFFFMPSNYDGVLHFVTGGANSVATITDDDLVDDHSVDIEQSMREDSISAPRVMHMSYYDVDGGLVTDKQSSERAGDRRAIGEMSVSSGVVMTAGQAATAVAMSHKVVIEELRGTLRFCLPDSWLGLVPTSPVIISRDGASSRYRISKVEMFSGYQQYEAVHDRQSTYTSNVEGMPAGEQTAPPSNVVGETLISVLDIPLLHDADDGLGLFLYVAISGTLPSWAGALVEISYDDGETYVGSMTSNVSSVIGVLLNSVGSHSQSTPDLHNVIEIQINTPNAALEESSLEGMMNGANLAIIGDELIQFANAEETSPGIWSLSYLLRGRLHTQPYSHSDGERFVLLDRTYLGVVPISLSRLFHDITFRATSFGESVDTATLETVNYEGLSQIEFPPDYLSARIDGTDLIAQWQGSGRIGSGASVSHAARFSWYHAILYDSDDEVIETRDTTDTSATFDISALTLPLRLEVYQVNSLTGLGWYAASIDIGE